MDHGYWSCNILLWYKYFAEYFAARDWFAVRLNSCTQWIEVKYNDVLNHSRSRDISILRKPIVVLKISILATTFPPPPLLFSHHIFFDT
jgi:hypothetical protein